MPLSRRDNLPLLLAFLFSIILNAGGMVFLQWMVENRPESAMALPITPKTDDDSLKQAKKREPEWKPGIENGAPATITWVGYEEYEEQLARQAEVEQAAFTMADGSPGQPVPPTTNPADRPDTPTQAALPNESSSAMTPTDITPINARTADHTESETLASPTNSSTIPNGENPALTTAAGNDPLSSSLTEKHSDESTKPSASDDEQPLLVQPTPLPEFKSPIKTNDPTAVNTEKSAAVVNDKVGDDKPTIPQSDEALPNEDKNKPVPNNDPMAEPTPEPSPDNDNNPLILPPSASDTPSAAPSQLADDTLPANPPATHADENIHPALKPSDIEAQESPADREVAMPAQTKSPPAPVPPTTDTTATSATDAGQPQAGDQGKPSPEPRDPKAQPSDKESSASSVKPIPEIKWNAGKPLAVKGMEIKPYSLFRHIFVDSQDTLFSVNGWEGNVLTNPVISLQFDRTGKVARVRVYRKSGYHNFDRKYLVSWLSRWTAYDKRLASLKKDELTKPIIMKLIFIDEPKKVKKKNVSDHQ